MSSAKFYLTLALIALAAIPLTAQEIELASTTLWTGVNDIVVIDDYAYCAFVNGLKIIDFSNPDNPVEIGKVYLPGETLKLAIGGSYAFVTSGEEGLQIVDISQPESPQFISTFSTTGGNVQDVKISSNYAYLADKSKGLYVVDISDPEQPELVYNWNDDYLKAVFIQDHFLYAASGFNGFYIFDISISDLPELLSFTEIVDGAEDIFVEGDFAYINSLWEFGLLIYYVGDPDSTLFLGEYYIGFWDFHVYDDRAYLGGSNEDLVILDVSTPANPDIIGSYETSGFGGPVFYTDNTVYLGIDYYGIDRIDVSDPEQLDLAGTFVTPLRIYTVNKHDNYLYAGGFNVLDDSDPYNPVTLGEIVLPEWTQDIYLTDEYAYVASGENRLNIVDITNPLSPEIVGVYIAPGSVKSVEVKDEFAYITISGVGIHIVDVSDPASPEYFSEYAMTDLYVNDIFIRDNYAFIAQESPGLIILDITDPATPTFVSSYLAPNSCRTVYVRDNLAYLSIGVGYHIVDIRDINNPVFVISWGSQDHAYDIWSDGHYAYLADRDLWIVDISDLPNVYSVARYPSPGWASEIYVEDELIYISDRNSLMIFQFTPTDIDDYELLVPTDYGLVQNYPNPFNASTLIRYELPNPSRVTLEIYDLLGRKVTSLVNRQLQAGYHQAIWNADDFPSGVYFYKLQAGGFYEVNSMILIK